MKKEIGLGYEWITINTDNICKDKNKTLTELLDDSVKKDRFEDFYQNEYTFKTEKSIEYNNSTGVT